MMDHVSQWLTGIVAAGCMIRLVRILRPKGAMGRAAEFTGGLVLLGALLQPLGGLEISQIRPERWERAVEQRTQIIEDANEEALCTVIEQHLAAYISDKEPTLTAVATAEIVDGTAAVTAVEVTGPYSPEMSRWIEETLGVGAERQVWHDGET